MMGGKFEIEQGLCQYCIKPTLNPWKVIKQTKVSFDSTRKSSPYFQSMNKFKIAKTFSILSTISSFVTFVAAFIVAVGIFGNRKFKN